MNKRKVYPTLYDDDIKKKREDIYNCILENDEHDQFMRERARQTYEICYSSNHINLKVMYDNCFLEFVEGNVDKSFDLAKKYITTCKERNIDYDATPAELMMLGQSHLELAEYFKAIDVLSELINKDPTNKEAYFHRSAAYFETGNFEKALADYESSDKGNEISKSSVKASNEFTQALIASASQSACDSASDFFLES